MCVAAQVCFRKQFRPAVFRHIRIADTHVDRRLRWIIAREIRCIDIEAANDAGHTQTNDTMIVTRCAAAPALPAIHPLAMIIVLVVDECRLRGIDQAFFGREKFITRERHPRTESRLLESNKCVKRMSLGTHCPIASSRSRAIL